MFKIIIESLIAFLLCAKGVVTYINSNLRLIDIKEEINSPDIELSSGPMLYTFNHRGRYLKEILERSVDE